MERLESIPIRWLKVTFKATEKLLAMPFLFPANAILELWPNDATLVSGNYIASKVLDL